jgi:hypothetical protein
MQKNVQIAKAICFFLAHIQIKGMKSRCVVHNQLKTGSVSIVPAFRINSQVFVQKHVLPAA